MESYLIQMLWFIITSTIVVYASFASDIELSEISDFHQPSYEARSRIKRSLINDMMAQEQVYSYQERVFNGSANFQLKFYAYSNPSDTAASGKACDAQTDAGCDVLFDICISQQGLRDCSLYRVVTGVVGSGSKPLLFGPIMGGVENPLNVDMSAWQGVSVLVRVFDDDGIDGNMRVTELIDQFFFVITDLGERLVEMSGTLSPRSKLTASVTSRCSAYYYGSDCRVFCDSASSVYRCLPDGTRVCKNGFDCRPPMTTTPYVPPTTCNRVCTSQAFTPEPQGCDKPDYLLCDPAGSNCNVPGAYDLCPHACGKCDESTTTVINKRKRRQVDQALPACFTTCAPIEQSCQFKDSILCESKHCRNSLTAKFCPELCQLCTTTSSTTTTTTTERTTESTTVIPTTTTTPTTATSTPTSTATTTTTTTTTSTTTTSTTSPTTTTATTSMTTSTTRRPTSTSTTREPTTKTTTTMSSTSTQSSTSTASVSTTPQISTTPSLCPLDYGYVSMYLYFISYSNPSDRKATGPFCDRDGTSCDIVFEICISTLGTSDCSYFKGFTGVLGQSTSITFGSTLDGYSNPLVIDLGPIRWQGVSVLLTSWDDDKAEVFNADFEMIDEFDFNITSQIGGPFRTTTHRGIRLFDQNSLILAHRIVCPQPLTSSTSTTSTTSTTSSPASATNPSGGSSSSNTFRDQSSTIGIHDSTSVSVNSGTSTTQAATTQAATTQAAPCPLSSGYSRMTIKFLSFFNVGDLKASGIICDPVGSTDCEIFIELCVGKISSNEDCSLFSMRSTVIDSGESIYFKSVFVDTVKNRLLANPVPIDLGSAPWQGVFIHITVWDSDSQDDNLPIKFDMVDEFKFNFTDSPMNAAKVLSLDGLREKNKTRLNIEVDVSCPTPLTTGTTTTAPQTSSTATPSTSQATTVTPLCLVPDGFAELEVTLLSYENGLDIKANGDACDYTSLEDRKLFKTDRCDLVFDICVSPIGKSDCSVLKKSTSNSISDIRIDFANFNLQPYKVNMGSYAGLYFDVTVWDVDSDTIIRPRELVDKISFNYEYTQGNCSERVINAVGREAPKSLLQLNIKTCCKENYFGPGCNVWCDDSYGGFTCSNEGVRQWLPGYTGLRECGPTVPTSPTTTTTPSPTSSTTANPTSTPIYCSEFKGYLNMYLLFYYYSNPTDQKATGVRCDNDNNNGADLCDLVLEICVSKIGSSDCEFLQMMTAAVDNSTQIVNFDRVNPVTAYLGTGEYKGANVRVKVWDQDPENEDNQFLPFDMVDEFNFDYFEPLGAQSSRVEIDGVRNPPKSRLALEVFIPCRSPTTTPTTVIIPSTTRTQSEFQSSSIPATTGVPSSPTGSTMASSTLPACPEKEDPFCDMVAINECKIIGRSCPIKCGLCRFTSPVDGSSTPSGSTSGSPSSPTGSTMAASTSPACPEKEDLFCDMVTINECNINAISRLCPIKCGLCRVTSPADGSSTPSGSGSTSSGDVEGSTSPESSGSSSGSSVSDSSSTLPLSTTLNPDCTEGPVCQFRKNACLTDPSVRAACPVTCGLCDTGGRSTASSVTQPASTGSTEPYECSLREGYLTFTMNFLTYDNPSDLKSTGLKCDRAGVTDRCDLAFEICVSDLNNNDCKYKKTLTDLLGPDSLSVDFRNNIGATNPNPITVHLGSQKWEGLNVYITVWDQDDENMFVPFDLVDEFSFNFTSNPRDAPRVLNIEGIRHEPKSYLSLQIDFKCPTAVTSPASTTLSLQSTTEFCYTQCKYAKGSANCTQPDNPFCIPDHCLSPEKAAYCPYLCNLCTTTPSPTSSTTILSNPSIASAPSTSVTSTISSTKTPICPRRDGCARMFIKFLSYENPTDEKATNVLCDVTEDGAPYDFCDTRFDICVSELGRSDCMLRQLLTNILGEAYIITFGNSLAGLANPIEVAIPMPYEGVSVQITVWDQDTELSVFRQEDMIDEFYFNFTSEPGSPSEGINLLGIRTRPTRLRLETSIDCPTDCPPPAVSTPSTGDTTPSDPTTKPTTTSTTQAPKTTPVPKCQYDSGDVFLITRIVLDIDRAGTDKLRLCSQPGVSCSFSVEICLSAPRESDCGYSESLPNVRQETRASEIRLTTSLDSNIRNIEWKGTDSEIKVWLLVNNFNSLLQNYHLIDTFHYELRFDAAHPAKLLNLVGEDRGSKLSLFFNVRCPIPPWVTPSTTSRADTTRSSTTQRSTRSVTSITAYPDVCLSSSGKVTLTLSLEKFSNPSDHKMDDVRCDENSMCDLVMTLCISSKLSPRSCSIYKSNANLGEATEVLFGARVGSTLNPLILVIDDYAGVTVEITIWDADESLTQPFEQVAKFGLVYDKIPDSLDSLVHHHLMDNYVKSNPSSLDLKIQASCYKPPTTSSTTLSTPSLPPSTTQPPTTTKDSSASTRQFVSPCFSDSGLVKISILFETFSNPTDEKATGLKCDETPGDQCDLAFEVCISKLGSRDCEYFSFFTEVVIEGTFVMFGSRIGGLPNPLVTTALVDRWQGVDVYVTIWDKDTGENIFVPYDEVDEMSFTLNQPPGAGSIRRRISGIRRSDKTLLSLSTDVSCPELPTTTPTTTTTSTTISTTITTTSTTSTTSSTTTTTPTTTTLPLCPARPVPDGVCTTVCYQSTDIYSAVEQRLPDCSSEDEVLCDKTYCSDPVKRLYCPQLCGLCTPSDSCRERPICTSEDDILCTTEACQFPEYRQYCQNLCGLCDVPIGSCSGYPCGANGKCIPYNSGLFECTCAAGYVQPVEGARCQINPVCRAEDDLFCSIGFCGLEAARKLCKRTCGECIAPTGACASRPCGLHGDCINQSDGSFKCECDAFYSGISCNVTMSRTLNRQRRDASLIDREDDSSTERNGSSYGVILPVMSMIVVLALAFGALYYKMRN